MSNINPELALIDTIAEQVQDDERILEGLAAGTLSLEEVEAWHQRRWRAEKDFMKRCGELVADMRRRGLGGQMSRGTAVGPGSTIKEGGRPLRGSERRHGASAAHEPPPAGRDGGARFSLDLSRLGLPCSLTVGGTYDEVLDAAIWHARHCHGMRDAKGDLVAVLRKAIVEEPAHRLAPEERLGRRGEELVSDEAVNQTRSKMF